MNKVFAIIFLSIFLTCLLANCSKDSPTSPEESKDMWPLKVGNNWAYVKNTNTNIIIQRIRVISIQRINNTDVPKAVWENIQEARNDTFLLKSEIGGVYFYFTNNDKRLAFKYPVKVGNIWPNKFEGGIIECISTNEQIQTPAGNFKCIIYRFADEGDIQNKTFYSEIYLCPNIGIVAIQERNDGNFEWLFLKSFQVN